MKTIYTALVKTESSDVYVWAYASKPTVKVVVKRLWEWEGKPKPLSWYEKTTFVEISTTTLLP